MRDRIIVDKTLIPYNFDILLGAELYNLGFDYNEEGKFFTASLSRNDEVLVSSEKMIYGNKLFASVPHLSPVLDIVLYDESGKNTEITYENFGESVFLTIQQGGETS